jgi:CubicO group peptidase (beta-lactamase class C family)
MKKGILASILIATVVSVVLLNGVLAGVPQVTSESEGFSSERLARIGAVMRAEIDKGTLPGAVTLIARHGKVVHFEGHGYLDAGKTTPMTQDAVFRMFSMTKPFVSVVAMMLIEQGRMKLSDSISTWIPECKDMKVLIEKKDAAGNVTREPVSAERPITVQDLLRHTSGFAYADNAPFPELKEAYNKADIESRETDVSPEELVQRLAGIPLAWQPGTRWQYGVSTDVLGYSSSA